MNTLLYVNTLYIKLFDDIDNVNICAHVTHVYVKVKEINEKLEIPQFIMSQQYIVKRIGNCSLT